MTSDTSGGGNENGGQRWLQEEEEGDVAAVIGEVQLLCLERGKSAIDAITEEEEEDVVTAVVER